MAFLSFLSPIFGSKPKIANYTPVDMSAEQIKALEGDIAAWPDIAQLGGLYQQYMLDAYETAIPGFRDILKMGGQTTRDMLSQADTLLKGEIPPDVQAAVERSTAFESLRSGTAGSPMSRALTSRDLGLTSLDLIGQGANLAGQAGNAAQRWAALSGAQLPEGMLVTPQQQAALDMQQNLIKRNIKQQKFNVEAAPDPVAKGLSDIVANLTAAYVSSLGGGGGKGATGAPKAMGATDYGVSDVSSPGYYTSGGSQGGNQAFTDVGSGADYYGGYGGVSPGSDGTPAYSGISRNPFTDTTGGVNWWDTQAYQSNFPTGG